MSLNHENQIMHDYPCALVDNRFYPFVTKSQFCNSTSHKHSILPLVSIVASFTLLCYVPGSDHPAAVPWYGEDDLLVCY
jgi:hypothetical protein